MEIDQEKIEDCIKRGYIDVSDHIKFKYIIEILRLFNINVNGWMKGSYILNENEGIMFTKVKNENWTDTVDEQYMYELCNTQKDIPIAEWNEYWGDKTIYIFRKNIGDDYEFIGCFKQDMEKIKELFSRGINNQRPYKRISTKLELNKFQEIM